MIDWLVNLLALGGLALVVWGIWMMYVPAGVVAAGLALLVVAWVLVRGSEEGR